MNSRQVGNRVAVRHAARMVRQSGDIARQNMMRQQMMNRQRLSQLVQQVVDTPATWEDLQRLAEISQDAQQQDLEPDQVEAKIRESTPFDGLPRLLPKDRTELYAFLALLVAIIQVVVALNQSAPETKVVSPEQVEEIIERVIDHIDHDSVPDPPPTTLPHTE